MNGLEGTLGTYPVAGSGLGGVLRLEGSYSALRCAPVPSYDDDIVCNWRLEAFTAYRDKFDVLSGSLTYWSDGYWYPGRYFSQTFTAEFGSLVR